MRLIINIVRKDWFEFKKTLLILTAAMFLPIFLLDRSADFTRGAMVGLGISASYAVAYFCFSAERQSGTLSLLLSLPLRPAELVLAKYASLYSMVLTTLVPAVFFRDPYLLFVASCFALFLSTLCMAFTVVSDKAWAPIVPMWFVLIGFVPIRRIFERFLPDGLVLWWAALALALTPCIAIGSAWWFERNGQRGDG